MTASTPATSGRPLLLVGVLATGAGGALGAVTRWSLTSAFPVDGEHFPWTTLLINVVGSALLAGLPLVGAIRRRPWLALLLGTGVLGGFTTMSAASTETFALLDHGHVGLGLAYCLGTLAASVLAVQAVDRRTTIAQRTKVAGLGADL
ncbi:MAG: CrcB family protein [Marmoricola sp.]